ncbi:hypothetical protein [Rathayibacter sp. VKM Ac-2801]|uniref:hypothetical protein n=1 Tax=Rathayibacter sp. VKM Ac-2801 TaxID=2609255 RepID=UPI00131FF742|nr:hypothetical protein [Rathayibacter sp. VKM Ac-2801]QHC71749.1 hypothetical protein GSU45_16055 [Rathayibacter sp. VKM Ac-2801]
MTDQHAADEVPPTPPGFAADIRPLFREMDRTSMLKAFDLWSHADVVHHQDAIIAHLADGSMPCDGPWPADRVDLLRSWVATGSRP